MLIPYWILWGYSLYAHKEAWFYSLVTRLTDITPIDYTTLTLSQIVSFAVGVILFAAYASLYFQSAYKDKVQTRIMLKMALWTGIWINLLIIVQPRYIDELLPVTFIPTAILGGHLFVLTYNRTVRILFHITLIVLILLLAFNLWIRFFNF